MADEHDVGAPVASANSSDPPVSMDPMDSTAPTVSASPQSGPASPSNESPRTDSSSETPDGASKEGSSSESRNVRRWLERRKQQAQQGQQPQRTPRGQPGRQSAGQGRSPTAPGTGASPASDVPQVFSTDELQATPSVDPNTKPIRGVTGRRLLRMIDESADDEIAAALGDIDLSGMTAEPAHSARPIAGNQASERRTVRVLSVRGEDVFVDLGGKSEGVVPILQFGGRIPAAGDLIEVILDKFDANQGFFRLRLPGASQEADWGSIEKGMIVDAIVKKANKGGLEVLANGLRGFLPAGQASIDHIEDLSTLVGQKLRCQVIEANATSRNLVVSRRALEEQERAERAAETLRALDVGQVHEGVVKRLLDFGAFVDIGGVDGLLHIKDMAWTRVRHPRDILAEGQQVRVLVSFFDPETKKIGLSLRDLLESPWTAAAEKYRVGTLVRGKVTRTSTFGAFVELEPGIEGLIHISEISNQRIRRVEDVLQVGQEVDAKILSFDGEEQRIGLSFKQAIEAPEPEPEPTEVPTDGASAASSDSAGSTDPPVPPAPPKRQGPAKPLKGGLGGTDGLNWGDLKLDLK